MARISKISKYCFKLIIALVCVFTILPHTAIAGKKSNKKISKISKSMVVVNVESFGKRPSSGSGFIFTKQGHILTCRHVLLDDKEKQFLGNIKIGVPKKEGDGFDYYPAIVLHLSPPDDVLDVALLKIVPEKGKKIPSSFPYVKIGDSDDLEFGDDVFTLGYPGTGLENPTISLTKGTVSNPKVTYKERFFIQTDAAVNPGNSGGALLNEDNEVVGIVTHKKAYADNMGFALRINQIMDIINKAPTMKIPSGNNKDLINIPKVNNHPAKKEDWSILTGEMEQDGPVLVLHDLDIARYKATFKKALPENFKLSLNVALQLHVGNVTVRYSQRNILRMFSIGFGGDPNDKDIFSPKGYRLQITHAYIALVKNGRTIVANHNIGNEGFKVHNIIITKVDSKISVTLDGMEALEYVDPDILPVSTQWTISGYLSRAFLVGTSWVKIKEDEKKEIKKVSKEIPKLTIQNVQKIFSGKVKSWDPQTRSIELEYDFADDKQTNDWTTDGKIKTDDKGIVIPANEILWFNPMFEEQFIVNYSMNLESEETRFIAFSQLLEVGKSPDLITNGYQFLIPYEGSCSAVDIYYNKRKKRLLNNDDDKFNKGEIYEYQIKRKADMMLIKANGISKYMFVDDMFKKGYFGFSSKTPQHIKSFSIKGTLNYDWIAKHFIKEVRE